MSARDTITEFTMIPNVGKATAEDFYKLGLHHPKELIGLDPYQMHAQLEAITQCRHDPCVIDVFIAAVRFMEGEESRPWWHYTPERKAHLAKLQQG
ncbi:helix-hairpin-helix domain-containing protein [Shewanella alkalitolerans]|uniref:helix-hairpin-helix domain-containing protein n=1 Tax=Shewanella alkalitolerans TaxID=2864209 RepID=UPI001C65EF79|nr:helix-hairpin-helix domain-containing protein [Shewanella alkalitolerans]QYJ98447.1 helix-hairpin-helix domain-containing protein [Shewanella alkalitolerans]